MVTYSIDKTSADIGETVTLSRSENPQQITFTYWIIDLQPSDYDFAFLTNPLSNPKCLSSMGKLFKSHSELSATVTIEDNHTIAHTLTPITVSTPTTQYLTTMSITPINELQQSSTFTVDIGEPIEVNFNRNIYNQLKFLVNRWTKGKEDNSNKVTSISSSSTNTQYPSAKCTYNQLAEKLDKEEDNFITVTNSNIWNSFDYHTTDRWSSEGASDGSITSTTLASGSQGEAYYVYNFPSNVTSITMSLYCDSNNCIVSYEDERNVITISTNSSSPTTYTTTSEDGLAIYIANANATVTYSITSITFNMNNWIDKIYPIGAIYISMVNVAPSTLFGGEWTALEGRFLIGQDGTNYWNGATGGSATVSLTKAQMPRHNHTQAQHRHTMTGNYSDGTGSDSAYMYSTSRKIQTRYTEYATPTINHTGGTGSTNADANGSPHENMPPYIGVYMWKRIG